MSLSLSSVESRRPLAPRLAVAVLAALALVLGPLAALPASAAPAPITGSVVFAEPGPDVNGIDVTLEVFTADGENEPRWEFLDQGVTDDSGTYTFPGVEAGTYRVTSDGPSDIDDFSRKYATAVSAQFTVGTSNDAVVAPQLSLVMGGTISGTTSADESDAPLPDVRVIAYRYDADQDNYAYERETRSNGEGGYTVVGLRAGSYHLGFSADGRVDEFYDNLPSRNSAGLKTFTVSASSPVAGKDASLALPGSLSGLVTDAAGTALEGVSVYAQPVLPDGSLDNDGGLSAETDQLGRFTVADAGAFEYKLSFATENNDYEIEYYDNARTEEAAESVPVTGGQDTQLEHTVVLDAPEVTPPVVIPPVVTPPVVTPPVAGPPAPPAAVVKVKPSIKVSAKAGKKKATLTITVKAPGVTPTGKVTIKLGGKTLKTVTLKRGKASVTLKKLKKGKSVFTIVYSGDSRVVAKTVKTKKIPIK
jgi:hypothetical protein